jgi:hypothetical protein
MGWRTSTRRYRVAVLTRPKIRSLVPAIKYLPVVATPASIVTEIATAVAASAADDVNVSVPAMTSEKTPR